MARNRDGERGMTFEGGAFAQSTASHRAAAMAVPRSSFFRIVRGGPVEGEEVGGGAGAGRLLRKGDIPKGRTPTEGVGVTPAPGCDEERARGAVPSEVGAPAIGATGRCGFREGVVPQALRDGFAG